MTLRKVGDRLRVKSFNNWTGVEGTCIRVDNEYAWLRPDPDSKFVSGRVIPDEYYRRGAGFYHESYELIDLPKLEAGDRVRVKKIVGHWGGIEGEYIGRIQRSGSSPLDYFRPDVGSKYADGSPVIKTYITGPTGACLNTGDLELIERVKTPEQTELEELRAFKAEALEKFPELAPVAPVDPDLVVARQMAADEDGNSDNRQKAFIEGKYDDSMRVKFRLEGIKMGRKLAVNELF